MSIFKKSGDGFLAKLFKLGQVEELAEGLAHTYAEEMQEVLQSENACPIYAERTGCQEKEKSA